MMGAPCKIENALLREAASVASRQAVRRVHLLAEMMRFESRFKYGVPSEKMDELSRDAENCAKATERLMSYNPKGADGTECPHCWILNGEHVLLRSDKGGNSLRCDKCEWRHGRRSYMGMIVPRTSEAEPFWKRLKTANGDNALLVRSASHGVTHTISANVRDRSFLFGLEHRPVARVHGEQP